MGLSQQRHAIVHVREGHGHSHIPIVHGQHQEHWGSGSERSEIDEEERGTESHLGYGGRGLYCRFGGANYFRAPRYMSFARSRSYSANAFLTEFMVFYRPEKEKVRLLILTLTRITMALEHRGYTMPMVGA